MTARVCDIPCALHFMILMIRSSSTQSMRSSLICHSISWVAIIDRIRPCTDVSRMYVRQYRRSLLCTFVRHCGELVDGHSDVPSQYSVIGDSFGSCLFVLQINTFYFESVALVDCTTQLFSIRFSSKACPAVLVLWAFSVQMMNNISLPVWVSLST